MRRVWLLASLLAAAAGAAYANGTTTLVCNQGGAESSLIPTGALNGSGCWTNLFITTTVWDSLDWGAPSSPTGQSGLGIATPGNSFAVTTSDPVQTRTATSQNRIAIQLAPDYLGTAAAVYRVDDFASEFSTATNSWAIPGAPGTAALAGFAGHFNSATGTPAPGAPAGDHLLELTNGGPLELTFLTTPVFGVWFEIAALSGSRNTLFVAEVQGFDASGDSLGTYQLTETANGTGGICASLAGKPPVPCNDAPYVGFYDPEGRVSSIYISVFNPGNLSAPIGFAIDTLELDPSVVQGVPEPATPLILGGGLAAIALLGRKRWALPR